MATIIPNRSQTSCKRLAA